MSGFNNIQEGTDNKTLRDLKESLDLLSQKLKESIESSTKLNKRIYMLTFMIFILTFIMAIPIITKIINTIPTILTYLKK